MHPLALVLLLSLFGYVDGTVPASEMICCSKGTDLLKVQPTPCPGASSLLSAGFERRSKMA